MKKLLLVLLLTVFSPCIPTVKIQTDDNKVFEYTTDQEINILQLSKLIKRIIKEDIPNTDASMPEQPIPLLKLDAKKFEKIFEYLTLLYEYNTLTGDDKQDKLALLRTTLARNESDFLSEIIIATNYLEATQLLSILLDEWLDRDLSPKQLEAFKQGAEAATSFDNEIKQELAHKAHYTYGAGNVLFRFEKIEKTRYEQCAKVTASCISGDGKKIAINEDHRLALYDIQTKQKSFEIQPLDSILNCITFSPNGKYLAGIANKFLRLSVWDLATHHNPYIIHALSIIKDYCFSPKSDYLAMLQRDCHISLIDIEKQKLYTPDFLKSIRNKKISHVSFGSDENTLMCSLAGYYHNLQNNIWIINLKTGTSREISISPSNHVENLVSNLNGRMVATIENGNYGITFINIYDTQKLQLLHTITHALPHINNPSGPRPSECFFIDDSLLIARYEKTLYFIDTKTGSILQKIVSNSGLPYCMHYDKNQWKITTVTHDFNGQLTANTISLIGKDIINTMKYEHDRLITLLQYQTYDQNILNLNEERYTHLLTIFRNMHPKLQQIIFQTKLCRAP